MDSQLIDFQNEMKSKARAKEKELEIRQRQRIARRKIEILTELKNYELDSADLILIM